jgi:hypothetical protein
MRRNRRCIPPAAQPDLAALAARLRPVLVGTVEGSCSQRVLRILVENCAGVENSARRPATCGRMVKCV